MAVQIIVGSLEFGRVTLLDDHRIHLRPVYLSESFRFKELLERAALLIQLIAAVAFPKILVSFSPNLTVNCPEKLISISKCSSLFECHGGPANG